MRRFSLWLFLGLLLLAPLPKAFAQESLQTLATSVTSDFPTSLTFHLRAEGPSPITKVELRFTTDHRTCAEVETSGFPDFEASTSISTQWTWDTRKGGNLPPGATVSYRWLLQDERGAVLETPIETYVVTDNNHQWRSIQDGMITLRWYNGDDAFAATLIAAAQEALDRLERFANLRPTKPIALFVYGSGQELRDALMFPQQWTGGVSFSGFNIVAIGISPGSLVWGSGAIAHELTHVIIDQVAFNCFTEVPTWLNEGLATYNEGDSEEPPFGYAGPLEEGIESGTLLSVPSLSKGFPTDAQKALMAYGESFSIVQYLNEAYGSDRLRRLLMAFRDGPTADAALQETYGFDQSGLDVQWRRRIGAAAADGGPSGRLLPLPTPIVPTIEPLKTEPTLSPDNGLPAAAPSPISTPTATAATPTPSPTPATPSGGCSGGLPPNVRPAAGNLNPFTGVLPLWIMLLGGLVLGVRLRR